MIGGSLAMVRARGNNCDHLGEAYVSDMANAASLRYYIEQHLTDPEHKTVSEACSYARPGHNLPPLEYVRILREESLSPAELIDVDDHWISFNADHEFFQLWTHDTDVVARGLQKLVYEQEATLRYCAAKRLLSFKGRDKYGVLSGIALLLATEPSACSFAAQLADNPVEPPAGSVPAPHEPKTRSTGGAAVVDKRIFMP